MASRTNGTKSMRGYLSNFFCSSRLDIKLGRPLGAADMSRCDNRRIHVVRAAS